VLGIALDKDERYKMIVDPSIALDAIIIYAFKYHYSIHADIVRDDKEHNAIMLIIKNKDKQSIHISKRARMLIEQTLQFI
jgi:hypothetical protein